MAEPARNHRPNTVGDVRSLCAFTGLCLAVAAGGGAITARSIDSWYQALVKPPFNPPDWVFAPVWTTLYILMGIAAWRVWRRRSFEATRTAFAMFGVQLCLNLGWTLVFFGLRRIDMALVEIVILLIAIITNAIMFWRIDRLAGLLLAPYAVWVTYATLLNASLWLLNRAGP